MIAFERKLVDVLLQPIVDRMGIDPEKVCWSVYRSHAIGFVLTNTLLWLLVLQGIDPAMRPLGDICTLIALAPIITLMIGIGMRLHSMAKTFGLDWMVRITSILFTITTMPTLIIVLTKPHAPTIAKGLVILMFMSMSLTIVATYLQICRKPPRPRDRKDGLRSPVYG